MWVYLGILVFYAVTDAAYGTLYTPPGLLMASYAAVYNNNILSKAINNNKTLLCMHSKLLLAGEGINHSLKMEATIWYAPFAFTP
jgi:hypothetical protein